MMKPERLLQNQKPKLARRASFKQSLRLPHYQKLTVTSKQGALSKKGGWIQEPFRKSRRYLLSRPGGTSKRPFAPRRQYRNFLFLHHFSRDPRDREFLIYRRELCS